MKSNPKNWLYQLIIEISYGMSTQIESRFHGRMALDLEGTPK